jgi:CelD/BcsL family acetyltransferase involved in cellulose biosynthesis
VVIGRVDGRIVLLGIVMPSTRRDVLPIDFHGLQLNMTGDPQQDIITTEYNGFMVDLAWVGRIEAEAIAFLLSGVVVAGQRRDELHLKNIAADFQQTVGASGFAFREVQRKPSWRVDLDAIRTAGKQYLDCLSANTRQQIRRSMRRYEKRGELTAVRASSVSEALTFFEEFKELHQRYWNGRGEPGGFSFPFFEAFQRRLIRTCMSRGTIELVKVSAGAFVVGYVYNLVYRGHVSAYQTGFQYEADSRLKPGLVSHTLCINRHLADGNMVYDFLAGEHRYKANLGEPGPDMIYLLAERPTWPHRFESALYGARGRLGMVQRKLRHTG